MKTILILSVILVGFFNLANAQDPIVFNWDGSTEKQLDENTITDTKDDVTVTVTSPKKLTIIDGNGFGGTTGNVLIEDVPNPAGKKKPALQTAERFEVEGEGTMNVGIIKLLNISGVSGIFAEVFVFTPYDNGRKLGDPEFNEPIYALLKNGELPTIQLDWKNITGFTITSYAKNTKFEITMEKYLISGE